MLSDPAWIVSMYGGEKVYLGVRVKMPVRDLLRKIRIAQGCKPQDFQVILSKCRHIDKQRVKTSKGRRSTKRKRPTKSLEELAIIVEVLEEDLRTGNTCLSPPQYLSPSKPPVSPEWSPTGKSWGPDPHLYSYSLKYNFDKYVNSKLLPPLTWEESAYPQVHDWNRNNSAFFWAQLQKEESQLRDISDAALLAPDGHGRTALHKVACVGKRALGYAIAKKMAAFNSLELKDSEGMTALLHAAKHNHHLMVADLIHLGANVNETNNSGKTCLHLSAEKGYIRVLEVLRQAMMDGVYVDVEATDNSGMSVFQCASVALKATVRELESSKPQNHISLHTLCQEQMMETLECLLQMGSHCTDNNPFLI
uniref:Zgc:113279 n=1 Tax=Sander lucioperca TaxID=283035 RepID=A0A8C9XZK4_SANLU